MDPCHNGSMKSVKGSGHRFTIVISISRLGFHETSKMANGRLMGFEASQNMALPVGTFGPVRILKTLIFLFLCMEFIWNNGHL